MKLLVLGGTKFLGRHVVEAALARGDEVTLFNRGQHNADIFPGVEKLRGDRDGGLDVLRGRRWDAVLDTSGYVPRMVRASVGLLADAAEYYVFVSSVSVYEDFSRPNDEDAPTAKLDDETVEEVTGETYGALKALCERVVEEAMPGRALNVRPGLIVGPYDPTGRFTYWPERIARGGEVLAPAPPGRQIQFVDARDLSEWMLRMAETRRPGVFNACGPDYVLTMGGLLRECVNVSRSDARITWVDEQFLLVSGVEAWSDLPLWVPESDEKRRHFLSVRCDKAFAAGLTFRPLAETIRDTLAWQADGSPGLVVEGLAAPTQTIKSEREAELLKAWNERNVGR
jgi:2'-hydroxyisoflavone reductase